MKQESQFMAGGVGVQPDNEGDGNRNNIDTAVKKINWSTINESNIKDIAPTLKHKLIQEFGVSFCEAKNVETALLQLYKEDPEFITLYKFDGFRAYYSIAYDNPEVRQRFLKYVVKDDLGQRIKKRIFSKYAEFVVKSRNIKTELQGQFKNITDQQAERISQKILSQGITFLESLGKSLHVDVSFMDVKLDNLIVEVEIFKKMFKYGEVSLNDLEQTHFKIVTGPELAKKKEIVSRMKEIYQNNWRYYPKDTVEALLQSLDNNLKNPNARFYTLYHKGKIIAFNCFTTLSNGEVSFSNFNVDPKYKSHKIGEAMMATSLEKEAEKATITANVLPDVPIKETYLKKHFKIVDQKMIGSTQFLVIKKSPPKN